MTNKIIIDGIDVSECKYKIKSSENFKNKPYCSILCKFCEEVFFVCDKNCQVFEDLKQLKRKEQECEELKQENGELKAENFAFEGLVKTQDNLIDDLQNKNDSIQNIADDLQRRNHDLTQMLETKEKELNELKEEYAELEKRHNDSFKDFERLRQECEILKTQYNCYACGTCKGKEDYGNMKRHCENSIKANHKYKQTLDEIEEYCTKQIRDMNLKPFRKTEEDILDIINKAREE